MPRWSTALRLPFIGRISRPAPSQPTGPLARNSPPPPIRIPELNDDVLLNIFVMYRLEVRDEDEDDNGKLIMHWGLERWWYKLAQVCRQWRYLILSSPIRLDLHLVCTYGTPIADMLAHSPPLPLIITFLNEDYETTSEDEEGVLCALQHRDRVRRIGLWVPAPNLRKFITAMDDEFPNLERLFVRSWDDNDRSLLLPKGFQAPHLRRLILWGTAPPTVSPLLTSTANLVTLVLHDIPSSAYFHPGLLLTRLASMPQLETLAIRFHSPVPSRDVKRELLRTRLTTHVTLLHLRRFIFRGVTAYLEGLLPQLTFPLLSAFEVIFFNQLSYTVTNLLTFLRTSEQLKFGTLRLRFTKEGIVMITKRRTNRNICPFRMLIGCQHFDWQVASAVQIISGLEPLFSLVEKLAIDYEEHQLSSDWHEAVDNAHWQELLRPFNNVKTFHVHNELFGKFGHSLQSEAGGDPTPDLLPNLKDLGYFGGGGTSGGDSDVGAANEAFTLFTNERLERGRPVCLSVVHVMRTTRRPRYKPG